MRGKRSFFVLCLFLGFAALEASAWDFTYGPAGSIDQANRRVTPVVGCPQGPGYVAIGTQVDPAGGGSDAYVVFTDLAGWSWPLWEATYDIHDAQLPNEGIAIVELPAGAGFVFLANTWSGVWYPSLTHIDCYGNHLWTQIYRDGVTSTNLRGQDLIRTQTGDPGDPTLPTAPGDFAVAGLWWRSTVEDAFLLRTDAAGLRRWDLVYDTGGSEAFNALTEAAPLPGQITGDLVAVGRYQKAGGGDLQGLAARVNGNNGGIFAGGLQCMAHHGQAVNQDFYTGVVQLTAPGPYAGQLAMVGTTRNPAWLEDIWVVRGSPCAVGGQTRIGNLPPDITSEQANDVREVLVPPVPWVPAGSLAIAGSFTTTWGDTEGALLFVGIGPPPPMAPIFGATFGGGPGAEIFHSLAEAPAGWPQPGYVLAGLTTTDWQSNGDPQQLYLVQHDPATSGSCFNDWTPSYAPTGSPVVSLKPQWRALVKEIPVAVPMLYQWNPFPTCF